MERRREKSQAGNETDVRLGSNFNQNIMRIFHRLVGSSQTYIGFIILLGLPISIKSQKVEIITEV